MQRRWLFTAAGVLVLGCTGAAEFAEPQNPVPPEAPSAAAASAALPSKPAPSLDAGAPPPDAAR